MNTATARRYAKALFDLAQQEKQLEAVRERLDQIDQMIQTVPELLSLCQNPIYHLDEKKRVLERLATQIGSPPLLKRFIQLLVQKNRLPHLPEIVKVFSGLVDAAQGRQNVRVRLARELSSKQLAGLRQRLEEMMHRTVELKIESDPSLIGGMVIHVGGRVYDGSVREQLRGLRRDLIQALAVGRS